MEGLPALWKGEETVQEVLAQQTLVGRGEPSLQSPTHRPILTGSLGGVGSAAKLSWNSWEVTE